MYALIGLTWIVCGVFVSIKWFNKAEKKMIRYGSAMRRLIFSIWDWVLYFIVSMLLLLIPFAVVLDDMILLLGRLQDVEMDFSYDTSRLEAFYVPAGTAVELYATTLHYVPCAAKGDTFRSIVVLPQDTNQTLAFEVEREGENQLLMAQNKWLIAHEEAGIAGAFCGLQGENITFL